MYCVNFFKGYNDKCFIGMSADEVIHNMPSYIKTAYLWEDTRKDIGRDFSAYYDENGKCNAIELDNPDMEVYVKGEQLMGLKEKELVKRLKKIFPDEEPVYDGESYMYIKYAFAVCIIDDKSGAILVGKKGYYDFLEENEKKLNEPVVPVY
ncbi:MAG: hypothetical protein ACI4EO_07330 [Blautia sp.]